MVATAPPLADLSLPLSPQARTPRRRVSLRTFGMLAIVALIALATVMVSSALLFRGAVQAHLRGLEEAHARFEQLQQVRQDAEQAGADGVRLVDLDLQLRHAGEKNSSASAPMEVMPSQASVAMVTVLPSM